MLSRDRFQKIRDLFEQALEQPPDTRTKFLAARAEGDTALASEVAHLLSGLDDLDDCFLEPPTGNRMARVFADLAESARALPSSSRPRVPIHPPAE